MVRIIIKGGRNTEDEILKAAISKYGKNQWARISSLLVRKTPKQCKARWYEWLDPSIKKVEWSKTEDEKLLHLAKLMPTQWRTIAPIVGRTATQCLERYQKLLDEAESIENAELGLTGVDAAGPSADDVRRLRPGEVDPDPETKPARPDPIDMDEDEKEMLSEARARLANTQGKKAKRKARERQLEEARRLAVLQKKRELKAAGIIGKTRVKKGTGMDYNADIPFNKQPAPGFYDTSAEKNRHYSAPIGQTLAKLEGKRKAENEAAEKKKKAKTDKDGEKNTQFAAARGAQIQKLKEADQIGVRRRLVLPEAQVGERELEEIVKIGQAGETARDLVEGDGDDVSGRLLGTYDDVGKGWTARTPQTAPQQDHIMNEARNIRNMIAQQTPLLGDENTPLHATAGRYDGATPHPSAVSATPNPLATPFRSSAGGAFDPSGATPRSEMGLSSVGATPLRTPMRDSLNINPGAAGPDGGATPAMSKRDTKNALLRGFAGLPSAQDNFDIELPEEDEAVEVVEEVELSEEDAAERDRKLQQAKEAEMKRIEGRKSMVLQRGLPRPVAVNVDQLLAELSITSSSSIDDADISSASKLVDFEFADLVHHDSVVYPLPGSSSSAGHSGYEVPDDEDLATARSLLHSELAEVIGFPGAKEEHVKRIIAGLAPPAELVEELSWAKLRESLVYSAQNQSWVDPESTGPSDIIRGYEQLLEQEEALMEDESNKASKIEKKLSKTLGGYAMVNGKISKRITESFTALQEAQKELESFTRLHTAETGATPKRLESLTTEVQYLERKEGDLQRKYARLDSERRDLIENIKKLEEEKVIAEAEAAMDAMEE